MSNKYTEEEIQRALSTLNDNSRYRAMRKVAAPAHKNLQSTGIPSLILHSDPNPKTISNKAKTRFSKEQKGYLQSAYWSYCIDGKPSKDVVISDFSMKGNPFRDDYITSARNTAATHRSAKRSAKNLAKYGYVTLSYGMSPDYNWFGEESGLISEYQTLLIAEATMAGIEMGRKLLAQAGETTDPDEIKAIGEERKLQMASYARSLGVR